MLKAWKLPAIVFLALLGALLVFGLFLPLGSEDPPEESAGGGAPQKDISDGASSGVDQPRGAAPLPPDPVIITDPKAPPRMGGGELTAPTIPALGERTSGDPLSPLEPEAATMAGEDRAEDSQNFPWPPPPPSAMQTLPPGGFMGETLGRVAQRLEQALDEAGYFEKRYHELPGGAGFVLMTQLEQFDAAGAPIPEPDRWSAKIPPLRSFSLGEYIKRLFTAPRGFYRVIVFAVTNEPVRPQGEAVDRGAMNQFFASGASGLSPDLREAIYGERHGVTALIYQFEKPEQDAEAMFVERSGLPARLHLERARLWEALAAWR